MVVRSGLQNEVISLYRRSVFQSFETVRRLTFGFFVFYAHAPARSDSTLIRWTFRRPQVQEELSARNLTLVEHHIRQAKKSIELWENPSIKDVVPTMQMRSWETKKAGLWTPRPNTRNPSQDNTQS
ncbi:hypothetical protein PIIN_04834 [Serendipita indica DSM 11827]|uniref:Uncharacterized protein n=1 Tax=Serendipita indica (strain DSM 11827) TaxID=1109443 RepID=G4THU9_SERID|nr:hypothetical protein PIIN_04834 [Serendipita indica DSM 11827]